MELYVVDTDLEILGVVDVYKSLIWTERYFTSGDFELYLPATVVSVDLLQRGRFVIRADKPTRGMIIEKTVVSTDAEEGDFLTVSGRSLSSLLSRRIVWKQTTFYGSAEKICRQLVTTSMIHPEDLTRAVPHLALGDECGVTGSVQIQYTGDNVEEAVQGLCRDALLGYDISVDLSNRALYFTVYKGADRSFSQSDNPFVLFAKSMDNLLSSSHASDDTGYKNVAQVAGEGQGIARRKITVGDATGVARYELFVNAASLSSNSGEIDTTNYNAILSQEGRAKLAECATQETMDSDVVPNYNFVLGRDYFLGDTVEVVDPYGTANTPRVVEVIECEDDTGYTCSPTFALDE